jgi:superfamily II DNA or RNA helicase
MARNDGQAFEHHVVRAHAAEFDHTVWHTSVVPEDDLHKCKIIHCYNFHRLQRIARRRESLKIKPVYSDYGLDFLAKDKEGHYYAGQCKNYEKKRVTAGHVASFISIVTFRVGRGFLYTTSDLVVNLREDLQLSRDGPTPIYHRKLPLDFERSVTQPPVVAELDATLRPYQETAIAELMGEGKKILELGCGLGKTLIAGHVLRASPQYKLVICIAPLRISVENLHARLMPFLPHSMPLLVDSDTGGTTDPTIIRSFLNNGGKANLVIFTTFKSMENVLADILFDEEEDEDAEDRDNDAEDEGDEEDNEDEEANEHEVDADPKDTTVLKINTKSMLLLVDEVHNMTNKDNLVRICNKFENSLLLSATMPEELFEKVQATRTYSYGIAEGIRDGYVCDYEVILPCVTVDAEGVPQPDISIPNELSLRDIGNEEQSMMLKALFLAKGMLAKGSRRCIVYMKSCEECDVFNAVFRRVCETYHGMSLWCEKINTTVSCVKRREIMDSFQTARTHDLYIITSVRILDEAVDVPACDSEFITYVGDRSSDIRTVQRLQRGGRLNPEQPFKKNHLFIWATDMAPAINTLTWLREADVNFHKKIHLMNGNYDGTERAEVKEEEGKQTIAMTQNLSVTCMTIKERWERRRQEWIAQYERLGRVPSFAATDLEEKRAVQWQGDMRKMMKGLRSTLSPDRIAILNATQGWLWEEPDAFETQYNLWVRMHTKLGRKLLANSTDADEKKAAIWQNSMNQVRKGNVRLRSISDEQVVLLSNTPGWKWGATQFQDQLDNWIEQCKRHGKPKTNSTDALEKRAASWQSSMRLAFRGKGQYVLKDFQREVLNNTPGWKWTQKEGQPGGHQNAFQRQHTLWIIQYQKLGRRPKTGAIDDNERYAATWQGTMRALYKGIKKGTYTLTAEQVIILNNTEGWAWSGA